MQPSFIRHATALFLVGLAVLVATPTARAVVCDGTNNGAACDDGNACTQGDVCTNGVCVGSPIVCTASDQCHTAGTCNPANGVCSNPTRTDGSACNDGNACTQVDVCQAGICVGSAPVTCTASDQCHTAGTCNPVNGVCSNPVKQNGSACNDGNACTQTDVCTNGVCTGSNPVTCTASDQCHDIGTCNPSNGVCSNPVKPNGSACNDGNACTQGDVCTNGVCVGGIPVTCTASDQCHTAGTCNPANGVCSNPVKPNGSACNDGNACTQTDVCTNGVCTGNNAVTCTASDQCHTAGTCDPVNGVCSNPAKPDGSACNDGNPATVDVCNSGTCVGLEFHIVQTQLSGANFNVTFSTVAGHQYSLETSPDLAAWTPVNGSAFTGDGNSHTGSVDVTNAPDTFFVHVLVGP